jgi:hypothetical protein
VRSAIYNARRCNAQRTARNIKCTLCNMQHKTHTVQHAPCIAHRTTCSTLHVPHRAVQHATWAVRCAADPIVDAHHCRAPGMWRTACNGGMAHAHRGRCRKSHGTQSTGVLHRRGAEAVPEEAARVARPRLDVRRSHLLSLSRSSVPACARAEDVGADGRYLKPTTASKVKEVRYINRQRDPYAQTSSGPPLPHLHRDWEQGSPCHICTGTGLTPATSAARPVHEAMPCACGCRRLALRS